jgi:uncharacterized protein (TIGR02001 family)
MRKSILGLSAVLLAAAATPAFAQDEAATPEITVTANAAVVSDYRFRGVSQTDKRFALQGGITATHASGLYLSVWGSSIDDYVAAGSDQELDLIAGYSKTVGAATFDVGVLYYYYPGSHGANTDFVEPYASIKGTFGPATAKLTANYAPKTKALSIGNGKEDNLYLAGDLSAAVPNTPFGLTAHLGHDIGPSYLVPTTTKKTYTDWNVGATYTWNHLTFGVSYVDTNRDAFIGTRNITKAGVVGSLTAAF